MRVNKRGGSGGGGNGVPVRNGLVAEYRFDECRNLLKYSQQFDNAAWIKTNLTVTPNDTTAPDGTATADKLLETVTNDQHLTSSSPSLVAGVVYTCSVYVKTIGRTLVKIALYDTAWGCPLLTTANLTTLTFTNEVGAGTSIVPVGDGWYRISATSNPVAVSGAGYYYILLKNDAGDLSYEGDITKGFYLWGAQVEAGSATNTYVPTTDKQTLMDYSKPRKNLLLPNQANGTENGTISLDWEKNVAAETVTTDDTEHWQGSRCVKVVTTLASAYQGIQILPAVYPAINPSAPYTFSCYVKGDADKIIKLFVQGYTDDGGVATTNLFSSAITLTGDWTRYSLTYTGNTTTRRVSCKVLSDPAQVITFYVDGLQLEVGSAATAWEAPPNIGIVGSAVGTTTNDPTWTGEGAYFTTDDYDSGGIITNKAGTVQTVYSTTIIAHIPVAISAASTVSGLINYVHPVSGSYASVLFGAATGSLTNEIVTLVHQSAGTGYRTGWCDDVATIAVGWHSFTFNWNGTSYDILIDGVKKTTTASADGHSPLLTVTDFRIGVGCIFGGVVINNYFTGSVAYTLLYNRALTDAEISKNYAYLKSYLKKNRGIALP